MVRAYQQAREDRYLAANAVLALFGIDDPTKDQRVGALLVSEVAIRVIKFLGG